MSVPKVDPPVDDPQRSSVHQHGWSNCPGDMRRQVDRFLDGLHEILRDNLTGVYLHGSLAMGCFNPQRSDIDLLVVTRRGMTVETKWRIAGLLLHCSNDPRPIEISLLSESNLQPWRHPTPFDFHFGEDWRKGLEEQMADGRWRTWNDEPRTDADLAAHITITRHRGICLYGEPIADVFPDVPHEDYIDSIVSDYWWGLERIERFPVYFVLNACRILACLREGRVCSKDEGGAWALRTLPEAFHPLVAQALQVYRGSGAEERFDETTLERFVGYVGEQMPHSFS